MGLDSWQVLFEEGGDSTRVLLMNPPYVPGFSRSVRGGGETTRGGTLYYPIWLAYATGALSKTHDAKLIDAQAKHWTRAQSLSEVRRFKPEITVMDTNFASLTNDIDMARLIKRNTETFVVMVGPPASQYSHDMLQKSSADAVARYEYETTLTEIAESLDGGRPLNQVHGITFKENGQLVDNPTRRFMTSRELDDLPFVSSVYKSHLEIEDYYLSSSLFPMVQIFSGRGCPNRCTFCSWPKTLMGNEYRVRSIDNVLKEFQFISEELPNVKEVFIEDDTFTLDKARVAEFCRGYNELGLDVAWSCNARATLDHASMTAMKNSNCRLLVVGCESGSDAILEGIKKGITVNNIRHFSENARKANLLVHGDFIVGLPGETRETVNMTKRLIWETKPDILQVLVALPIPGTEFYDWCDKNDHLNSANLSDLVDSVGRQKPVVSYPNLSSRDLQYEADKMLKDYYLRVGYIPIAIRQVIRRNGFHELKRLVFSARIFLRSVGGDTQ
jgi:radical SAM superfamily enzyme YgiQ (UPF0313 family)